MCDRGATPSRRDASPAECYRNYDRGHLGGPVDPFSCIMRIGLLLPCALLHAVAASAPLAQDAYDLVIDGARITGALPGQVRSHR